MAKVEQLCSRNPRLTPLGGAIMAGIHFDLAHDSRSLSNSLGIEHALVLREVQTLVDLRCISITQRDQRTQRCTYMRAI